MLLYFGILYPNNCGSIRRLHHSALLLILLLHLPCPRISFTLNSKLFSLNNPFLLSLVCTNSCRFSGPYDLVNVFIWQSFSLCRSFSPHSSSPVSLNKPPSVLATWQALCRHSKSPHWSSLTMVSRKLLLLLLLLLKRRCNKCSYLHCLSESQSYRHVLRRVHSCMGQYRPIILCCMVIR